MHVQASVSFEGRTATAGRERIQLLAAVGREGSISAAARSVGLSYKAAWDAIDGMNALFGRDLVEARSGGRHGGGARLTASGIQVVETLTRLEGELTRMLHRLGPELRDSGISLSNQVPGLVLRTSARNALPGVIRDIKTDAVSAKVSMVVTAQTTIRSIITRRSLDELGLTPGRSALALVKASLIAVVPQRDRRPQAGNCISGTLVRKETGVTDTELTVDIGHQTRLVATANTKHIKALCLRNRDCVWATFDPRQVILAVG